jgi:pimeloyl-ACP methyl ester carboxylesterase
MPRDRQHVRIEVDNGQSVHAFVMRPAVEACLGRVAVFSHGFSVDGTESARHFLVLADRLVQHGWSAILFDYRGSGYSDRSFEDMTIDTEIADLHAVIEYAGANFPGYTIGVWGESLGAAVAAHTVADRSDVSLVVLWSLSAELHRRYRARFGPEMEAAGFVFTNGGFGIKKAFLDSLEDKDTYLAIKRAKVPFLLVHGDADGVAALDLARQAHRLAPYNTTLHVVPGGNHGFEAQPSQFLEALEHSVRWLSDLVKSSTS